MSKLQTKPIMFIVIIGCILWCQKCKTVVEDQIQKILTTGLRYQNPNQIKKKILTQH